MTVTVIVAADVLCLSFALVLTLLADRLNGNRPTLTTVLECAASVVASIIVLAARGLYPALGTDGVLESKRVIKSICFAQLACICMLWAVGAAHSQLLILSFWIVSMVALPAGRSLMRGMLSRHRWWGESVLLIGSGGPLDQISNILTRYPRLGFHTSGVLNESGVPSHIFGVPVLRDMESATLFAHQRKIDTAIVVLGGPNSLTIYEASRRYGAFFPKLIIVPPIAPGVKLCTRTGVLGGYFTIRVSKKLSMLVPRMLKRGLDVFLCISAAIVLSPLLLAIAACIKLTSKGPVFFRHRRIGRDDVPFYAWKFRTMVSNADTFLAEKLATNPALRAEWERDHKLRDDPRITTVGKFMRKCSLDELPQLWNVVRGDMSLVGPRPICSDEVVKYAEYFDHYARVRPGITGLWQISGRNETTYEERVQLDTYYVNNWSLWLDLYIIAQTFRTVLTRHGAY
jgi:Undecaprenyl-phosphate galactose phosphotransferase WbaP